jgi:hypothetical protein
MTLEQRLVIGLMTALLLGILMGAAAAWIRNSERKNKVNRMSFKIELGTQVVDKITGYKGMVIARTEWLYSCKRYVVQAREMKDGKPVETVNCDEDQLEIVEEPAQKHVMRETGGPTQAVTRGQTTSR